MIQPLRTFVVLEETKSKKPSELLIPDAVDLEPSYQAKVVAIGKEATEEFKIGDTVLIQKHLFNEIPFEKKQYLIGKSDGIMAVLNAD